MKENTGEMYVYGKFVIQCILPNYSNLFRQ